MVSIMNRHMGHCTKSRYLLHPRAARAQASLRIYAQTHQSLRYSHIQSMDVDEDSDPNLEI